MFSGGKLAPAPMRVSVSLKPTPGATSTLGRNVVVMVVAGRGGGP